MTVCAGINGFGRFALHLLQYWIERHHTAGYRIDFINDDYLSLDHAYEIIRSDPYVRFDGIRITQESEGLCIKCRDGFVHRIEYTHGDVAALPWIGQSEVILECSGKYTDATRSRGYLTGNTKLVLISATSWNADQTLVYGFNHDAFRPHVDTVISYGSCTVNGYVPLAKFMHDCFGVENSDVNVVHNIVLHKLADHDTLDRRVCTLERMAPRILPFVSDETNFAVTYSVVPWDGVSMIDFRFQLARQVTRDALIVTLKDAIASGPLKGLYTIEAADVGPNAHACTPYSAVFIEENIKVRGANVYLPAYFDTENSVNRYHDLASHVSRRLADGDSRKTS